MPKEDLNAEKRSESEAVKSSSAGEAATRERAGVRASSATVREAMGSMCLSANQFRSIGSKVEAALAARARPRSCFVLVRSTSWHLKAASFPDPLLLASFSFLSLTCSSRCYTLHVTNPAPSAVRSRQYSTPRHSDPRRIPLTPLSLPVDTSHTHPFQMLDGHHL